MNITNIESEKEATQELDEFFKQCDETNFPLKEILNEIEKFSDDVDEDHKKNKISQMFVEFAKLESLSEDDLIHDRITKICVKYHTVLHLLQILISQSKNTVIIYIFSKVDPLSIIQEYEECLFLLCDYLVKNKADLLFKYLQLASEGNISSLYPMFSLSCRKMSKASKLNESVMLANYMMHYGIEISTCCINLLIENLCKSNQIEEAQKLFNSLSSYTPKLVFPHEISAKFRKIIIQQGVNVVSYGTFLKCLCKSEHLDLALYYYEQIKHNLVKDEVIFNLLLDGCSKVSNLEKLKYVYSDMLALQIKPTIVTFNSIIDAFIRAKDVTAAWNIFDELIKNNIQPDNFTFSTLFRGIRLPVHEVYLNRSFDLLEKQKEKSLSIDIILINVLLDSCISMKEKNSLVKLFNKTVSGYFPTVKPDVITFNTFIKGCAQLDLYDQAVWAFETVFIIEIKPNDVTFNSMIDVCVRSNNLSKVWSIIEKMKENGVKPDNFTYSTIIKGLNKNCNIISPDNKSESELDIAFKLFENVKAHSKPDEILYNCIMDACLRFNRTEEMMKLYDEMVNERIKPSSITCGIMIKAFGMKGNLEKAYEVYEEMKREGIPISSVTYGCLINACIKNDDLNRAFQLYEDLLNNNCPMNTILYTTLIKAYSRTKNIHKVLEIFNKMKCDKNNLPNNVTFNSVIDCCIKCDEKKLGDKMFKEMIISGVKPDIITFSTLIKGCLKKNDLTTSLEYLEMMPKYDVKPDDVLLNSLLDGCEKMRKYKKGVEIFNYVRKYHVEPSMMAYSIMMKIYGKLSDFKSSQLLMEEVKKKHKNISLIIFTCFMKTCFYSKQPDEALDAFNQLKSYKLVPDSITYSTMLNGMITNGTNCLKSNPYDVVINILKESAQSNCVLTQNIYELAVNFLIKGGQSSKANEIKSLFHLGEISEDIKGDQNLSYLIDGYKHNHSNKGTKKFNPNPSNPLEPRRDLVTRNNYNFPERDFKTSVHYNENKKNVVMHSDNSRFDTRKKTYNFDTPQVNNANTNVNITSSSKDYSVFKEDNKKKIKKFNRF